MSRGGLCALHVASRANMPDECPDCRNGRQLAGAHKRAARAEESVATLTKERDDLKAEQDAARAAVASVAELTKEREHWRARATAAETTLALCVGNPAAGSVAELQRKVDELDEELRQVDDATGFDGGRRGLPAHVSKIVRISDAACKLLDSPDFEDAEAVDLWPEAVALRAARAALEPIEDGDKGAAT